MARVLGIDPGATTGFCLYDDEVRAVVVAGTFPEWNVWSTKGLAEGLGNRSVRVRIVPIARKRRRVGK